MFSRSALRPLTVAISRSATTHSAQGVKRLPLHGNPGKDRLVLLSENWVKGPMGVGLLAYICSGDCCAIKHEHSGLSLGIMEDGYYSSGITIGILTTFAVIRLLPAIAKWADGEIVKIESEYEKSRGSENKALSISPPKGNKNLSQHNADQSE
ncbi:ATP synthase subunit b, mitochondrial [Drosophila santomea]|uniref:ATP synthase subunit b, mitochondrial n=1 Tax=Drosophila santomea TaxID=129105 RepID=UPI0019548248|nr:ATP synthase subunit b, mitochondrial [Drosophila santomea]